MRCSGIRKRVWRERVACVCRVCRVCTSARALCICESVRRVHEYVRGRAHVHVCCVCMRVCVCWDVLCLHVRVRMLGCASTSEHSMTSVMLSGTCQWLGP